MAEEKKPKQKRRSSRGGNSASVMDRFTGTNEDISRIVRDSMQYLKREPAKTNEEVAERLNDYFKECADEGRMPTVEQMALALGIHRTSLWEWEHHTVNLERANMIKKAKQILASIDAALVSEGKIPQVTYIFRSKNFYGMKDQQEVVVGTQNPMGEITDEETLRKRYLEQTYGAERIEQKPEKIIDVREVTQKDKEKI